MPTATPEQGPYSEGNAEKQRAMLVSDITACLFSHPLEQTSVYNADFEEVRVLSGRVEPFDDGKKRMLNNSYISLVTCTSGLVAVLEWQKTRLIARSNYLLGPPDTYPTPIDPDQEKKDFSIKFQLERTTFANRLSRYALNHLCSERNPLSEDITGRLQSIEARIFAL